MIPTPFDQNAPNPRLPVSRYARLHPNATREMEGANGLPIQYSCGLAGVELQCKKSRFAGRNMHSRPRISICGTCNARRSGRGRTFITSAEVVC